MTQDIDTEFLSESPSICPPRCDAVPKQMYRTYRQTFYTLWQDHHISFFLSQTALQNSKENPLCRALSIHGRKILRFQQASFPTRISFNAPVDNLNVRNLQRSLDYTLRHGPLATNSKTLLYQWTNFHFFTVKFRKDLQRKLELKLSPPIKSVAHYLSGQLYTPLHSYQ